MIFMNENIEKKFVETYINKQYRDRLIIELKDAVGRKPKRSHKAFKKFSHNSVEYFVKSKILLAGCKITKEDFYNFVNKLINDTASYYMDEFGGEELSIYDAIEKSFNYLGASIIIYQQKFCLVKEETSIGSPEKIILLNDNVIL